ncbi:hypothetical protein GQ43DRAFT_364513 [Delitschia confertaspora ATCC 74209]|uniref:Uncharacterized protein n=1 Tax=Delitschia confertaspora ATCC 74209 TaxID=1513339 RepID=A0A9P4N252_9PLEO|nr:hypothetical protein GQ43DRAFT_364513 [Delitschia confertaspora ATCC 74209]
MAAPSEVTIKDLTGKWVMNKSLSDSTDPVLSLQGVGWLTRKAIGIATITQDLKQYNAPSDADPSGPAVVHIDFDQIVTGGLQGTSEKRTLDHQWRPHSDHIFGEVTGRTRWVKVDDLTKENEGKGELLEDAQFLVQDWDEETKAQEAVESFVKNEERGWTAWQIWGFAVLGGERRHVRRVVVRKGKEVKRIKLVYDWQGKN